MGELKVKMGTQTRHLQDDKNNMDIKERKVHSLHNGTVMTKEEKESNNNQMKLEKTKNDGWKQMSLHEKFKYLKSFITVEPILACYVMPSVLSALTTQNLFLEKACRVNLGYPDHVCDALTLRHTENYTYEEGEVQKLTASMAGWKTVLQSAFPCIIILFVGAWSDRVGNRKLCMLLPIVGEFLSSISLMINTYFFYELPMEVAGVTECIFPALMGGWFLMFMGVFSYIADVTTEEMRTLRIGIANMFYSLGVPIGAALSGILLKTIGFYGVFSLSATLYMISFVYGYFKIVDVPRPEIKKLEDGRQSCCEWLRSFFDVGHVKETILVAFKKGPRKRRLRVSLLIIVLCVVIGPIYGELAVMYLFTRYRFNWDEVDYSVFSTYSMVTSLVGTLFSVGVFSQAMKLDDAIVGVISCMSKILAGFVYAFSVTKWQIYIAPLVEIFNGTSFIAMRSMVSKLVSSDELGKVNSLYGVAEAMMPLVYAPMYTTIYTATIKVFPGAFFLLGGALTFPAVLIFAWLYYVAKKEDTRCTKDGEKSIPDDDKKSADITKNGIVNTAFVSEEIEANSMIELKPNVAQRISKRISIISTKDDNVPSSRLDDSIELENVELGFTESIKYMTKM